ncbi:glycoside hydrolase family 3 protein [Aerosakkonema funiforme]|uniref:beta-N-acetylhexosaminidase n=1 Tax=Aerosakkonema funiforme FACHB-1375 TaxID=2949571 RepID=A0A926ZKT7_9CYAN|nr:glycoside hydrolase family 3 protein [Aerosakkonema funiforme]MBD2186425.1 glycoside hydrolase family 3 protein [Aerosakkonema funiforme FACHB-1375]
MRFFIKIVKLFLALAILSVAFYYRQPLFAGGRSLALAAIIIVGVGLILTEIIGFKKTLSAVAILAIASLALCTATGLEIKFNLAKQNVLNTDIAKLEKLGQHFIVGYRNFDEIKTLASKRAIGGVFVTARNIKNKSKQEIQQEIQTLQAIRRAQGLSPLWIATDQEGGVVSRLSPPLTKLPQLSDVLDGAKNIDQKKDKVIQYATTQGKDLSAIGVNLNFAPVVDLNKGIISPDDKFSKIYLRAISANKEIVAKVALWYCQTLEKYGVRCTIKHFPGLGRVNTDTHIADAQLHTSVAELSQDDWVPFREVMSKSSAFTMLGHARLTAVDKEHPISFSQQAIDGIIRKDWGHDGVLITDDFSMQAVYGSKDGLALATVKAINAGVDLILIAFDKDLYYEAMDALLKAEERVKLDRQMLENSQKRLQTQSESIGHF